MIALVKDGRAIEGVTLSDALIHTHLFQFDTIKGCLYFNGKKDTITYSHSLTSEEMINFMAKRGVELMKRQGWQLYKSV